MDKVVYLNNEKEKFVDILVRNEETPMEITIQKLTPERWEDYIRFFDHTPHDRGVKEHACYCVCWCNDDSRGKDFSTAEKRRALAIEYIKEKHLQGYLAYLGDEVVGWCNVNTKADCLTCVGWRRLMQHVPMDDVGQSVKTKSIFCFVVAPSQKRKGIATRLLNRAIEDAVYEGFDFMEAYPYKNAELQSSDFGGYVGMFQKCGFVMVHDSDAGFVMRKPLK